MRVWKWYHAGGRADLLPRSPTIPRGSRQGFAPVIFVTKIVAISAPHALTGRAMHGMIILSPQGGKRPPAIDTKE